MEPRGPRTAPTSSEQPAVQRCQPTIRSVIFANKNLRSPLRILQRNNHYSNAPPIRLYQNQKAKSTHRKKLWIGSRMQTCAPTSLGAEAKERPMRIPSVQLMRSEKWLTIWQNVTTTFNLQKRNFATRLHQ